MQICRQSAGNGCYAHPDWGGDGELWTTLELANYPGFLDEKAAPRERYKASTSGIFSSIRPV